MTSHCQISQNIIIPPWICPRVRPTLLLLRLLHRLLLRFVGSRVVLQQFFLLLVAFWNLGKMTLHDTLAHTFTSAKQSMWFQGWVWLMIIAADDFKNLFHNSCFPDPLVPVLVPSLRLKLYFEYLMLSMINSMKKYLIMNKVGIVSAFLLGFQDLGLVQQRPVVTQNLEDLCDNQLFFIIFSIASPSHLLWTWAAFWKEIWLWVYLKYIWLN